MARIASLVSSERLFGLLISCSHLAKLNVDAGGVSGIHQPVWMPIPVDAHVGCTFKRTIGHRNALICQERFVMRPRIAVGSEQCHKKSGAMRTRQRMHRRDQPLSHCASLGGTAVG